MLWNCLTKANFPGLLLNPHALTQFLFSMLEVSLPPLSSNTQLASINFLCCWPIRSTKNARWENTESPLAHLLVGFNFRNGSIVDLSKIKFQQHSTALCQLTWEKHRTSLKSKSAYDIKGWNCLWKTLAPELCWQFSLQCSSHREAGLSWYRKLPGGWYSRF